VVGVAVDHAAETEPVRFKIKLVNEIGILEFAKIFPPSINVEFYKVFGFGLELLSSVCYGQQVGHLILIAGSTAVDLLIAVSLGVAALVHS
jgi:hypothetical protein